jgi:hypothetical protein
MDVDIIDTKIQQANERLKATVKITIERNGGLFILMSRVQVSFLALL